MPNKNKDKNRGTKNHLDVIPEREHDWSDMLYDFPLKHEIQHNKNMSINLYSIRKGNRKK